MRRGRRPPAQLNANGAEARGFGSEDELRGWLEQAGVPVEEYGQGEAKPLASLLAELARGEATLGRGRDGRVHRFIRGAHVKVFHRSQGRLLYLQEERQVFKDGRIRRRELSSSVGEKTAAGESAEAAAKRALSEELGIGVLALDYLGTEEKTVDSRTYPGLVSHFETACYSCLLPESDFDPAGYAEHQHDKSSYWIWVEADADSSRSTA